MLTSATGVCMPRQLFPKLSNNYEHGTPLDGVSRAVFQFHHNLHEFCFQVFRVTVVIFGSLRGRLGATLCHL